MRYVLEGSVQRGGKRLRVNVQLLEAETASHIWAERFDKPVADLFDMQDEIVSRLANALGQELAHAEARRAERAPQAQVEALERRADRAPARPAEPAAKPLRDLEYLAAGELAKWIKQTTPNDRTRVIRTLRECAAILEDELEAAKAA